MSEPCEREVVSVGLLEAMGGGDGMVEAVPAAAPQPLEESSTEFDKCVPVGCLPSLRSM